MKSLNLVLLWILRLLFLIVFGDGPSAASITPSASGIAGAGPGLCATLACKLLELISLSLNLPAKRLSAFYEGSNSFIRLNHYSPCNSPDLVLGVGHHKDSGGLTVLFQDKVGGLEIKRQTDGEWIRVKPVHNSFIVNLGDIIQVWSNDKYESVEHRVTVNSEKDRYSIPLFFNPASSTNVKPLEELVSEDNPPKYHEYNWGHFYKTRKDSNFQKLEKENIQIYHFKRV